MLCAWGLPVKLGGNIVIKLDEEAHLLLAATARDELSDEIVQAISQAIADHCSNKPRLTRLGDTAIEFSHLCKISGLLSLLKKQFGAFKIDFNILPHADRKKKILLSDMDATLIANECIDELAEYANVKDQVSAITARTMNGEVDFQQSIKARVALLKGLPELALCEVYEQRIMLNPGALTLGRTMAKFGVITGIVSGGFDYFTDRIAHRIGFGLAFANQLEIKHGKLTGVVKDPILDPIGKRTTLETLCRQEGCDLADAMCVGDGANDIMMISASGLGVAYHAKPGLEKYATVSIKYSDLTALLYLQGYRQSEFATR